MKEPAANSSLVREKLYNNYFILDITLHAGKIRKRNNEMIKEKLLCMLRREIN